MKHPTFFVKLLSLLEYRPGKPLHIVKALQEQVPEPLVLGIGDDAVGGDDSGAAGL